VVARRASREAKSMREESSSDEDTSSNEEWVWDPAQEQDEEDEEDEEDEGNWGIVDASTYGQSRLHQMPRAREDGKGYVSWLKKGLRHVAPQTPRFDKTQHLSTN
jgi:hypothetical protein